MRYRILVADDANPEAVVRRGSVALDEIEGESQKLPTINEAGFLLRNFGRLGPRERVVLVQRL